MIGQDSFTDSLPAKVAGWIMHPPELPNVFCGESMFLHLLLHIYAMLILPDSVPVDVSAGRRKGRGGEAERSSCR